MSILYILLAILMLGVLIIIHELGHFTAARLCGIGVKEFSVGFGPKIVQWRSKKHETLFSIRWIVLGGYCMFYGDDTDDPDGSKKDDPRNLNNAPVWKRAVTVFSGPLMNIVLAFVVAVALMGFYGVSVSTPFIASVEQGAPAQVAGLQSGDVLVSVGGESMLSATTATASEAIGKSAGEQPVSITVERDGEQLTFDIKPFYDAEDQRYRIGIMIQQGYTRLEGGRIIPEAFNTCVEASGAILSALGKLVTTGEGLDETTGPVGVVQAVAQYTSTGGLEVYLYLMVMISINLGLMNLLPIPGLDGSRLLFLLYEAVRGQPVSQKTEAIIHMCGYVFLFGVMIFFTFKDVLRIFGA